MDDQTGTAPPGPLPPDPRRQPPPPIVQVVNRAPGFGRVLAAFIGSLFALGGVFALGIAAGIGIIAVAGLWLAGTVDQSLVRQTYRDGSSSAIAVIPVLGVIDPSDADFVRRCVTEVLDDDAFEAVVLRVDSPGGGVTASDEIGHHVGRLQQAGLPVVASFGSVAASGGYYVSCGSDHIVAEETCITGSIGVIAQILTLEGLMETVGIEPVTLVATRSPAKKIANDIFRNWDDADRAQVLKLLDAAYDIFNQRVRDGRADVITDPARIDALANGELYTASEALDHGLVDSIGYLSDAVAEAEQRAGVARGTATVTVLHDRPTFFGFGPIGKSPAPAGGGLLDAEAIRSMVNELNAVRLMYLMN